MGSALLLLGLLGAASTATAATATAAGLRPCDIYAAAGTPCVAAHSVTRALYSGYRGPLYQLWSETKHNWCTAPTFPSSIQAPAVPNISAPLSTTAAARLVGMCAFSSTVPGASSTPTWT